MSESLSSPAWRRAGHLRHGINFSHWFSQVYSAEGYTPAHFDSYLGESDIALVRSMGFDHVRFPIGCEAIIDPQNPGHLPEAYVGRIERAIETILANGLAVMVDIHPEHPFKQALAESDKAAGGFVDFWGALAGRFAQYDAERTFFEILNEPCICDCKRWNRIQSQAAMAVRQAAPEHTIIISGDHWSQLPELLRLEPPALDNLIANFHLYDPIAFTHQGAGWSPPWAQFTKGLTYPADPAFIENFLAEVSDAEARGELAEYQERSWSLPVYRQFIEPAVAWGKERNLPLTCNEFGVYKKFAPRESRLRWIADLSTALEEAGIGWTMWDYAGDFAVVRREDGRRVPDTEVLAALRLG